MGAATPNLDGFSTHYGIPVCIVGDDDISAVIALGHHKPRRVIAAFNSYTRRELGWAFLDELPTREPIADRLQQRWAVQQSGCGRCGGDPECGECREVRAVPWWLDWSASDPVSGGIPVTVYAP